MTMPWWENDFLKVRSNQLELAGSAAEALADEHGTPLFVYGTDLILSRFRGLRDTLSQATSLESRVFYAMKANFHSAILRVLRAEGAWIDVVSPNELQRALGP
jgi:diaminopimelate decarboxylase